MNNEQFDINSEFIDLIKKNKKYISKSFNFPLKDKAIQLEAKDDDNNEYIIDINRKRANITRCTYQERYEVHQQLLRLDIDNKPHINPDGTRISGNHIHIYSDDYGDGFAFELDDSILNKINPNFDVSRFKIDIKKEDRLYDYFLAFSDFCNIKNIPQVQFTIG